MAPEVITAPPAPAEAQSLSHYQERIIEFVIEGRGHGVVRATAGAGKTSTLVAVAAHLDPNKRACFLAFGRDAAAELGRRLPSWVQTMTVHSLGRATLERALRFRGRHLRPVDKGKYRRLLRHSLGELGRDRDLSAEEVAACGEYLIGLLDLARLHLVEVRDDAALRRLVARHNIVPPEEELEPLAHAALADILQQGAIEAFDLGICDFTDMLHLPVSQNLEPPRFDFVCVDEAQDYSAAALAFTRRLVDSDAGGRMLFVGDPRQSIFGFAGADDEAMDRIVRETGATVLPLSITYRCPRSHVALARLLAPEIEAGPDATEGRVFWIPDRLLEHWTREGDMVICRANAPLVKTCLRLVQAGSRAYIRGRDLKRQLTDLSEQALTDGSDPISRLGEFESREVLRLRRDAGRRAEVLIEARRDLLDCLRHLLQAGHCGTQQELRRRIARTFDEQEGAVVLSTIHRAKGLESDRILILYPELMPAPYARTSHSLRGEAATQFVALTRARHDLVFVTQTLPPAPASTGMQGNEGLRREVEHLAEEDFEGQGKGAWPEVLDLARVLARRRG